MSGEITEKINLYCNDVVFESIREVSKYILPNKLMDAIYNIVEFKVLKEGQSYDINGIEYTFFDIQARGTKQFGFECNIQGKKLMFLGDETLNPNLYDKVKDAEYVMHEAFCLDSEENIFHAYEKNHSTGNLILLQEKQSSIKKIWIALKLGYISKERLKIVEKVF